MSRAEVMTWRDEASLSAMALVYQAAAAAMRRLEERFDTIALADAVINADVTAREVLQPAMRTIVAAAADHWFTVQAQALRRVDARLETLALSFSAVRDGPLFPANELAPTAGKGTSAWLRRSAGKLCLAIELAKDTVVERAMPKVVRTGAERLTARMSREIGERSGTYERLRAAARVELTTLWLGPATPEATLRPYLTQLLYTVDTTAQAAREIIG